VSNNAFTNRIVQWHLEKALAVYDWLYRTRPSAELEKKLQLTSKQRSRWQDIVNNLDFYDQSTAHRAVRGIFNLEDINLADYEPRTRSMQAILASTEPTSGKCSKPDVLMLLYLMRQSQEFPQRRSTEEELGLLRTAHRHYMARPWVQRFTGS